MEICLLSRGINHSPTTWDCNQLMTPTLIVCLPVAAQVKDRVVDVHLMAVADNGWLALDLSSNCES